eukprot:12603946-Alexandrium_andersonii.AAC.1
MLPPGLHGRAHACIAHVRACARAWSWNDSLGGACCLEVAWPGLPLVGARRLLPPASAGAVRLLCRSLPLCPWQK